MSEEYEPTHITVVDSKISVVKVTPGGDGNTVGA